MTALSRRTLLVISLLITTILPVIPLHATATYQPTLAPMTTPAPPSRRNGDQFQPMKSVSPLRQGGATPAAMFQSAPVTPTLVPTWSSSEVDMTTSVAWGDVDGDGDLDLAVGNAWVPSRLYRNDNGLLSPSAIWASTETSDIYSVAWGDMDGDGDLDLATGGSSVPVRVYRNDQGTLTASAIWASTEITSVTSLAWGDMDADGYLDLVVAGQPNRFYRNTNGVLATSAAWVSTEALIAVSVAWGDVDGDGDLDLAVASQPNRLYQNNNGTLTPTSIWFPVDTIGNAASLAWGDVDGDGDLDLAVGNNGQANQLYLNNGGTLATTAVWTSTETDTTYSVAWGDVDGDGDLDLAVGNQGFNRIYRNDGGSLTTSAVWSSTESTITFSLAWGDVDNDGDLDLVTGNLSRPTQLYRNDGGPFNPTANWTTTPLTSTLQLAWGDVNGDGSLDLAVANGDGVSQVYVNSGGTLSSNPVWTAPDRGAASVAWGDVDGDGDLDLATGNRTVYAVQCACFIGGENRLYRNDHGSLTPYATWTSVETDTTTSVAWGDVDGDGDLDLVAGNYGQPNRLYRNDDGVLTTSAVWSSTETDNTTSVAWGDVDNDGDPDLAVGNAGAGEPNRLYRNDDGMLSPSATWSSAENDITNSVAWGDVDGDGDLDLAVGNSGFFAYILFGAHSRLYRNDNGTLTTSAVWSSDEADPTISVVWGDVDGDGDQDLIAGNYYAPSRIYRNDGSMLDTKGSAISTDSDPVASVALGDVDGDGDPDLAVGNSNQVNRLYLNQSANNAGNGNAPPRIALTLPDPIHAPTPFASETIIKGPVVPLTYTLQDNAGDPVAEVRFFYALNGDANWHAAIPVTATTPLTNLAATAAGVAHIFNWDTSANGIFGQYDHVRVRAEVIVGPKPSPYNAFGHLGTTSLPFRLRGTQVQVFNSNGSPAQHAILLRRPAGNTAPATFMRLPSTLLAETDVNGYLSGRDELRPGDTLFALAPVSTTAAYSDSVTLYNTNILPSPTGATGYTVDNSGNTQVITATASHPLVLFHPDISLEWDARYDAKYLAQLEYDLQRASEFLFDATNGQAALGDVNLFFDKENWDVAHIRIYATNRLRPNAVVGGIMGAVVSETLLLPTNVTTTLAYGPGQLKMGATWNRFGDGNGGLAEDWARTLAHEVSHYIFFLDDTYIGLDTNGQLTPIETCPGLMSDSYANLIEFQPTASWLPGCDRTLANQTQGRSEWATITHYYPNLFAPTLPITDPSLVGPNSLPIALTTIIANDPLTPSVRLPVPIFYTKQAEDSSRYLSSNRAQAFLLQDGQQDPDLPGDPNGDLDRLTALGRPTLDQVLARGARVGDRLCVFDIPALRAGCETITAGNEQIALQTRSDWQPDITITPVTSRTLMLTVTNLIDGLALQSELFPSDTTAYTNPYQLALVGAGGGVYSGTFLLPDPLFGAYVHLWVNEPDPRREAISSFSLGGNPGPFYQGAGMIRQGGGGVRNGGGGVRNGGGGVRNGGGGVRNGGGGVRNGGGFLRQGGAPLASAEGDVLLFAENVTFDIGQFMLLQTIQHLPPAPLWATPIGQGYRFSTSPSAPSLAGTTMSFSYVGSDVPAGEEDGIQVYYRPEGATSWQAIPTTLNTTFNQAMINYQGPGIYTLMSSIHIPLTGPGWNNFGYPVQATRPITDGLAAIAGAYDIVYNYVLTDTADPWKLYAPNQPSWINDLRTLEFGKGYWINITNTAQLTLELRGASMAAFMSMPNPPATAYGLVNLPVGTRVEARINGILCGQTTTQAVGQRTGLVINVNADDDAHWAGCGRRNLPVTLLANGQVIAHFAWDSQRITALGAQRVFLPVVER